MSTVEKFDTRTAEVTSLKTKLLSRRFHSVVAHDGKLYVFAGQGVGLTDEWYEHNVEIYDPVTGEITKGPFMDRARSGMGCAVLDDKVYLIGGTKSKGAAVLQTNDVEIFDLAKNKWSRGVPMPIPHDGPAAVVAGFILVPGGFADRESSTKVSLFSPEANGWKSLPPLARKTHEHALAYLGENVFLFGDFYNPDTVVAYNLFTRKSEVFKVPGFQPVKFATAVVWRERIYVIGGIAPHQVDDETDLIQVFALNPAYPSQAPK